MGSSQKAHPVNIASILSVMLYLMYLLMMPADSATLSILRRKTDENYPSATTLHHKKGEFYVQIYLGNIKYNLIFDTGNTLFWVQCPAHMTRHKSPKVVKWSDNRCPCGSPNFHNASGWCAYDYRYLDGTRTEGYLLWEEFGAPVNAEIVFGCSRHTTFESSMIDGVLGMSRGSYSFIKQITDQYSWMFSFCITNKFQRSFLIWGPESTIPSDPHVLKMLNGRVRPEWYDVQLDRMFVGSDYTIQHRIDVEPEAFGGGCVLDTGTRVSRLVPDAFYAIVELMDAALIPNGFTKKINRESQQVCYDYPTEEWKKVRVPTIWLRFKGVSDTVWMRWGARQLFSLRNGAACLELVPSSDTWSTIGAFQLADIHFTFDLDANLIYFKENPSCRED